MPTVLENVIVTAIPDAQRLAVQLTWRNGAVTVKDMRPIIGSGGVFAALADPAIFSQVRVGDRGRSLVWPEEVDLCADALWFEVHPEDNPFAVPVAVPVRAAG